MTQVPACGIKVESYVIEPITQKLNGARIEDFITYNIETRTFRVHEITNFAHFNSNIKAKFVGKITEDVSVDLYIDIRISTNGP